MKGLEISEKYYKEYGSAMIAEKFPELVGRAAVGLSGEGSECFGFDDAVSRDHDFDPSFCIWLTDKDYEKYAFALEKAYRSLPAEFCGLTRQISSPTGGQRRGVIRIGDHFAKFLGSRNVPSSWAHWLAIPEYALAAATNGKVFRDDLGEFSKIRAGLQAGYPRDVMLKKLASALIIASQSGEYNYKRCLDHKESGAAQLAIFTFVKNISAILYLLNGRYMPFYKWIFRGMADFTVLPDLSDVLTFLIESGNTPSETNAKIGIISDVSASVLSALAKQRLVSDKQKSLELAAYEVNGKIKDIALRNESIFAGAPKD